MAMPSFLSLKIRLKYDVINFKRSDGDFQPAPSVACDVISPSPFMAIYGEGKSIGDAPFPGLSFFRSFWAISNIYRVFPFHLSTHV